MNLHAKFNRNGTKGKYSTIGGTEILEKKEEKNSIFWSDQAFFFKKIINFFPSRIFTFRRNLRAVFGEYYKKKLSMVHGQVTVIRFAQKQPTAAAYTWENYISICIHIEWDMIVVTVFISILNQMEIHLVQNRK